MSQKRDKSRAPHEIRLADAEGFILSWAQDFSYRARLNAMEFSR